MTTLGFGFKQVETTHARGVVRAVEASSIGPESGQSWLL
jgi:hypothetical protein